MRYFFDIFDGDHWTRDDIGMEARGDRHARHQAVLALTEMARELLPTDGDHMKLHIRVRTESDERFTVRLDFDTDRPPEGAATAGTGQGRADSEAGA